MYNLPMRMDKLLYELLSDPKLDLRARIFNLLGLVGTAAGLVTSVSSLLIGVGALNIALNLASSALAVALIVYANRTGRFVRCYRITVVVVFILFFPVMFFTAGGYRSGMPSFFIFAVLFTVFMLEGRERIPVALLETALYVGVCLIALRYPETIRPFDTETDAAFDVIVGFTASSFLLGTAMVLTFRMYDDARRQLAEKNATLERLHRLKTEFLGNVAHELKTPIAVMMGIAQNARRHATDLDDADGLAADLGILASENARLGLLVEQILDATRIDEGRMACDPRPASVEEIVQSTVNAYYPLLKKNGNRFEIRVSDDLPEVWADPRRVSQVLINLMQNAIRHTRNGKIALTAVPEGDFAVVTLRDSGEGIAPERLPHIFERYKSRESAGKGSESDTGTGLGLYICRHIARAHGGDIAVSSEPGVGTEVRFTLPFAYARTREKT
ncbi:HAMP domain-containing histidine kinase [Synergistaceae bacterium OttesenSCG-928-I11]|nr:HAMP domain-containing histidine kinase [Synergistaceae bacterium OttesenSCG-928-I11]